jgi:hypothetical protein
MKNFALDSQDDCVKDVMKSLDRLRPTWKEYIKIDIDDYGVRI